MISKILTAVAVHIALTAMATQAEAAIIQGKLQDSEGQPVMGYPVILESQDSAGKGYSENIGFTSENGEFSIRVDEPGEYTAKLPTDPSATSIFQVPPDLFKAPADGSMSIMQDIGTILLPKE